MHVAHQADRILQQPAAVRIERYAGVGEALVQRRDGLDLGFARQHAALELEVVEAVTRPCGLGETHDRLRCHRLLVAQPPPVVGVAPLVGRRSVRQIGLRPVADIEQVTEHLHRSALLPLAEQRRHRHAEELPEQIEHRGFHRRDRVDRRAQIEGLEAAAAGVTVGKARAHRVERRLHVAERLADHELGRIDQRAQDLLAARDFTDAGIAGAVGQDQKVAREIRTVRTGEIEQHAVAAGDRHRAQRFDDRRVGHRRPLYGVIFFRSASRPVTKLSRFDIFTRFSRSAVRMARSRAKLLSRSRLTRM